MKDNVMARIREKVDNFWNSFTDAEIAKIADGDHEAMADCLAKGGANIDWLHDKIRTPEEKRELEQVVSEIQERNRSKGSIQS
jgi:hypothetical protein